MNSTPRAVRNVGCIYSSPIIKTVILSEGAQRVREYKISPDRRFSVGAYFVLGRLGPSPSG